ncbi:MAG: hypothetical protein EP349_04265 [Alphaproteobacteria bacterium]|nr:MAG: hypothetical protein EP349_04265 [Alphaproteobacteria bacterium]
MNRLFFLKTYFFTAVFIFSLAAATCFFSAEARAQEEEPEQTYANSNYLPEVPPPPEYNSQILNCIDKGGYYIRVREFSCPVDKEGLLTPELGMPITFGRNLDWEPEAHIGYPPPMPVCRTSGAVITKSEYTDEELELLKMAVNTDEYKALYAEKHASYFLRAELNRLLELDAENRWWYLLNATWEASHCNAKDKYRLYALRTIEAAKERLQKIPETESEYWVLNLIIPNLYRRIANFNAAQEWLDKLGNKLPKDEASRENFATAFELLRTAVAKKRTGQVPMRALKGD